MALAPVRADASSWISCHLPNPTALIRLFCFPFAGGAASVYREWQTSLPQFVEVCPVQPPGRETRLAERPRAQLSTLIEELSVNLAPLLDKPYALFGHSMGALIAFEFARASRRRGFAPPMHLFASGRRAPHVPPNKPHLHRLPDPEFLGRIRDYNGTPEEVLASAELMAILLPVLRADFTMIETHHYVEEPPLPCDLSVLGGVDDAESADGRLEAWARHAAGRFRLRLFPGGHFFPIDSRAEVLADLTAVLHTYVVPTNT